MVDGEKFGEIGAELERQTGANCWINVSLKEGKKREVRRALEALELDVNRLIRVSYGPFELSELRPGAVAEVPPEIISEHLENFLTRRETHKKAAKPSVERPFDDRTSDSKLNKPKSRPMRSKKKRN